jgi:hypothetical protein
VAQQAFPNFNRTNPFFEFFETTPEGRRANFFARINQPLNFGTTSFANQQFHQSENAFLGSLGRQILAGQPPTATFQDELNSNFNFARQLRRAPTSQTGRGTSRFASPGRFLLSL